MPEASLVQRVFGGIARRYDLANRVISGGTDLHLRKLVVRRVVALQPAAVLDLATGSGDLAFALRRKLPAGVSVAGLDFSEPMLDEARKKQAQRPWAADIRFGFGDILNLDVPDSSVDVVTIAWGLRNLEDRQQGLREMLRVLRPGGTLLCLEFSQPYRILRGPYYAYMKYVLPPLARILTGDRAAYEYLTGTVSAFPGRAELAAQMQQAGFDTVKATPLMGAVFAIHEARKAS